MNNLQKLLLFLVPFLTIAIAVGIIVAMLELGPYVIFIFIFGGIILYTIIHSSIKVKKGLSSNKERNLALYKRVYENEITEARLIRLFFEKLGLNNYEKLSGTDLGYRIDFSESVTFNFLSHAILTKLAEGRYKIDAIIRDEFPFTLSIVNSTLSKETTLQTTKMDLPDLSKDFIINSNLPKLTENLLQQSEIKKDFLDYEDEIIRMSFDSKFLTLLIRDYTKMKKLLILLSKIHSLLNDYNFESKKIETLYCYACGDKLDPFETTCDKCGAPRPRCVICLLDLKRSEKEEVIQTPCCEVYVHKKHILSWLENKPHCPNCGNNLSLWKRNIKKEIIEKNVG